MIWIFSNSFAQAKTTFMALQSVCMDGTRAPSYVRQIAVNPSMVPSVENSANRDVGYWPSTDVPIALAR